MLSQGMNKLCEGLASIPQVTCTVEDFYDAFDIKDKASAAMATGQRLVLVGHSFGANAALYVAAAMKGPVPLVVTIDPNWFAPPAVPENAEIVLNYYQTSGVIGHAVLQPPPGFQGKLHQFHRSEPHHQIDASTEIHAEILTRVRAIVASPDPSLPAHKPPSSDLPGSRQPRAPE